MGESASFAVSAGAAAAFFFSNSSFTEESSTCMENEALSHVPVGAITTFISLGSSEETPEESTAKPCGVQVKLVMLASERTR